MKSVAFFRNTWGKRNKDKNTTKGNQDVSIAKQVVLVPQSAPCTPTAMAFKIPVKKQSLPPDRKVRSQSENSISFQVASAFARKASSPPSGTSSTCSVVDHEVMVPAPRVSNHHDISHPPPSPVVWKSSHGPPRNATHGPPSLNLYSPVSGTSPRSTGGSPPVRPPRPPPLNLHHTTSKRPVNTGIPPRFMGNRAITFSLPANPRAFKPVELTMTIRGSSSDSPPSSEGNEERACLSSEETIRCLCVITSPDSDDRHLCPHRSVVRERRTAVNPPKFDPLLPSPNLRTAQAVLDLSDTPAPHRMYRSAQLTSSTPHLPSRDKQEVPPVPPLPFISSNRQADDVSNFPLSLFPAPPRSPLFVRRKIAKNFVLRPDPTSPVTPLHSSLSPTSPDYTPLVTPTTPRPQPSTIHHSKSFSNLPRYPSPRTMPPPLFDPPSTPLPTPPASPALPTVRPCELSSPPSPKYLRSVKSINELHSEQFLPPLVSLTHRTTSSEPPKTSQNEKNTVNKSRRQAQYLPEGTY